MAAKSTVQIWSLVRAGSCCAAAAKVAEATGSAKVAGSHTSRIARLCARFAAAAGPKTEKPQCRPLSACEE